MAGAAADFVGGSPAGAPTSQATSAFSTNPATGDAIVVFYFISGGATHQAPTDTASNTYTQVGTTTGADAANRHSSIWIAKNITGGSSFVVTGHWSAGSFVTLTAIRCTGLDTTSPYNGDMVSATNNTQNPAITASGVSPAANSLFLGMVGNDNNGVTYTAGGSYSMTINALTSRFLGSNNTQNWDIWQISSSAISFNWTGTAGTIWTAVGASFQPAATGIAFDVAGNSGDQAAANSYSGSASWNGVNRMLSVDVSLLGPGVTVTAMTYGGANCTFIGKQASVTSFGSVECWRIVSSDPSAPGTGANTLSITLSGSLEFSAEWVSYTGVHQTVPTEAFNSAQATNAGSATDASVVVTTVADNCWVHAAVAANDTSISAGNTTRNNIAGTLGSGANEDNNAAKTPAGTVTMSYTGMGLTTTWTIAGYAIRPTAASGLTLLIKSLLTLLGVG